MACRKAGVDLRRDSTSRRCASSCAAGSPLPPEGYDWVYEQLGPDVLLNVGSGGTDVCTGIVQGGPLQPVYRGEIVGLPARRRRRGLRLDGRPVVGELGELVIRKPMPSMPVRFWNDPDGSRYRAAYFEDFPGVWRHGDWIMLHRARQLRDHRPLRRDAQPRRRAARDGRVLPRRRGASRRSPTASSCTSRTPRADRAS